MPTAPVLSNFQLCDNQLEMAILVSDSVIHFVIKLHSKLRDEALVVLLQEFLFLIVTHVDRSCGINLT